MTESAAAGVDDKLRVGTLVYTKWGLVSIFVWMLWGDLVFTLMEKVVPESMPLQLSRLGVPAAWIGVMMVTVGQVVNMTLVPPISFRSDRTRTRWGRRIPYILLSLPLLCLTLAALGFTDSIGGWARTTLAATARISPTTALVGVIGTLIVLFNFFNAFVNSVFWYLFADVIPPAYFGRFMAAFRLVGAGAEFLFYGFAYKHLETATPAIYVGAAVLYFFGFGALCLRVREGQYPPPDDAERRCPLAQVGTYFRQCFTHPMYVSFYISRSVWALSNACLFARILFYRDGVGLSMEGMGGVRSWAGLATLVVMLPMGWVIDKLTPIRAMLLATALLVPLTLAGYWTHSLLYFAVLTYLTLPFVAMFDAAEMPMMAQLLPRAQYGQFASANSLVRSLTMLGGSVAGVWFMATVHRRYGPEGYGLTFVWAAVFAALSFVATLVVYAYWKRLGTELPDGAPEITEAERVRAVTDDGEPRTLPAV